jgi:hypothetical protein
VRRDKAVPTPERARLAGECQTRAGAALAGIRGSPDQPPDQNTLAWFLATWPDPAGRDPGRAVALARKATQAEPNRADFWNTLGVALYRAADHAGARAALEKAEGLGGNDRGRRINATFLAMTLWLLGEADAARAWRAKADAPPAGGDEELARFRAEAETVFRQEPGAAFPLITRGQWDVLIDADEPTLKSWLDRLRPAGRYPVAIHAHGRGGKPVFAATAVHDSQTGTWEVFFDRGVDAFQRRFEEQVARRWWVHSVCGYSDGGTPAYVSVWMPRLTDGGFCRSYIEPRIVTREAAQHKANGIRMLSLSIFPLPGGPRSRP